MKYLLVIVVVGLVLWLMFGLGRRGGSGGGDRRRGRSTPMIACAHCGVHLPRDEAVFDRQLGFCCEAHRRAGARDGSG